MNEKELRAFSELGIADFESADIVKAQQADMLERLKSNAWLRNLRTRLESCSGERCGNDRCVEVCAFAAAGTLS
jgi:hypothetical protein